MLNKSQKRGFQFIVTRPSGQATELVSTLSRLLKENSTELCIKHSLSHIPLLTVCPLPKMKTSSFETLSSIVYSGVIFISKNAFYFARELFTNEQWKKLMSRPIFTIGIGTKQAIVQSIKSKKSNVKITSPDRPNTEGLLELPKFDEISDQNWLIVRGVGGREKLKTSLIGKGAMVSEAIVYQRIRPSKLNQQITNIGTQSLPIWIVSSKDALKNLSQSLKSQHESCRVITSSDRISEAAIELSMKVVAQAKNASDDALVECIASVLKEIERID